MISGAFPVEAITNVCCLISPNGISTNSIVTLGFSSSKLAFMSSSASFASIAPTFHEANCNVTGSLGFSSKESLLSLVLFWLVPQADAITIIIINIKIILFCENSLTKIPPIFSFVCQQVHYMLIQIFILVNYIFLTIIIKKRHFELRIYDIEILA